MSEKTAIAPPSLSIGDEFVVMTRNGQTRKVVARILGREHNPATGIDMVWLDRRIHRRYESTMLEGAVKWSAGGAISTVLAKAPSVPEQDEGEEMTARQIEALEARARIAARIAERRGKQAS